MKPREKLKEYGIHALSDNELIALILGHGTKKENIFDCSKRILEQFDHNELVNLDKIEDFRKNFSLGNTQSAQLMAVFELGKRFFRSSVDEKYIRTPEQVYEHLKKMENLQKEHCIGLYLNARYRLIYEETLCIGGLNAISIHPREVLKPAIEHNAYAIIIAHNHPSGDPNPSEEDLKATKYLEQTSEIMNIPLLDHIIIGKNSYKSLHEAKNR